MRKQNVWALCLMGMACLVSCNNEQEFSYMKTDSPLNLTAVQVKQSVQSRASSDNQWIGVRNTFLSAMEVMLLLIRW